MFAAVTGMYGWKGSQIRMKTPYAMAKRLIGRPKRPSRKGPKGTWSPRSRVRTKEDDGEDVGEHEGDRGEGEDGEEGG